MSSPRKGMHGFIHEIIGVRQQERQCTGLRTNVAEQTMKTRVMRAVIHLAVEINAYSPWLLIPTQAGSIPSIDVNRRLIDQCWALDAVNTSTC